MSRRWLGWVGLGWVGLSLAACEPIQYVDVVGTAGTRGFLLPFEGEGGGGQSAVGSFTGPVTELRYTADSEKRIYLVRGDLDEGVDPIAGPVSTLRFPESPDTSAERVVAVGEDQSWDSLRTYDIGACSLFVPWPILEIELNRQLRAAFMANQNVGGPVSVTGQPTNVGPVLIGDGSSSLDQMRYNGTLRLGDSFGCYNVNVDFETRYWPTYISSGTEGFDRACPLNPPYSVSGAVADIILQPIEARAEVQEYCTVESAIENSLINALETDFPGAFLALVDELRTVDRVAIGMIPRPCTCDTDCVSDLSPRRRCMSRDGAPPTCQFVAEIDRVMVMPEGVTFVYAESVLDDFQGYVVNRAAFGEAVLANLPPGAGALGVEYACGAGRAPTNASTDLAEPSRIPAIYDPAGL